MTKEFLIKLNIYCGIVVIFGFICILIMLTHPDNFGGVRGGKQTGFYVGGGESISIGSSSPSADFTIFRDTTLMSGATTTAATATMQMYASGTPAACLIFEDIDSAGNTYCNFLNGVETCSSTNICN